MLSALRHLFARLVALPVPYGYSPMRWRAATRLAIEYPFPTWEVYDLLRRCSDDEQKAQTVLHWASACNLRPSSLVPVQREGAC